MGKVHSLNSPMVFWSLDVKNDSFRSYRKIKELLGPKVPYLNAIGALMYLTNCTQSNIIIIIIICQSISKIQFHSNPKTLE